MAARASSPNRRPEVGRGRRSTSSSRRSFDAHAPSPDDRRRPEVGVDRRRIRCATVEHLALRLLDGGVGGGVGGGGQSARQPPPAAVGVGREGGGRKTAALPAYRRSVADIRVSAPRDYRLPSDCTLFVLEMSGDDRRALVSCQEYLDYLVGIAKTIKISCKLNPLIIVIF